MSFDPPQFIAAIAAVLRAAHVYCPAAVRLLAGTAAVESGFGTFLRQKGDGPALGAFQMEPATEKDIWENYLAYRQSLALFVASVSMVDGPDASHLQLNLIYQILMARIHYLRVTTPIPTASDPAVLGQYWKDHYNTRLGKGHVAHFVTAWDRYKLGAQWPVN
jgi:hypothetical protein